MRAVARLMFATGLAFLCMAAVTALGHAEGAAKAKSKIAAPAKAEPWTPYAPIEAPADAVSAHSWYIGMVGGHAWSGSDGEGQDGRFWHGGIVGGWLYRPASVLGLGIEADYVVRDLGALEDGVASLRGRVGVFAGATFLYATAGVHETWAADVSDRRGLVVGAGIEREVAKNWALRLEALHYRHADEYFAWGDDGSTSVRAGALLKF